MINIFDLNTYDTVIKHAIEGVLLHFKLNPNTVDIEIGFLTKEEMRQLNLAERNIDKSTDVLSFPAIDNLDINNFSALDVSYYNPENDALILGEIYICEEIALEQAKEYKHSIEREIAFLSVHGCLHLMGYDHITNEDERVMFNLQDKLLIDLGYNRN